MALVRNTEPCATPWSCPNRAHTATAPPGHRLCSGSSSQVSEPHPKPAKSESLSGVPNPPPRMAMNAAQHKLVHLLKAFFLAHHFLLVFVYLTCGPRQLFFFHYGPEMPKGWTPLHGPGFLNQFLTNVLKCVGKAVRFGSQWSGELQECSPSLRRGDSGSRHFISQVGQQSGWAGAHSPHLPLQPCMTPSGGADGARILKPRPRLSQTLHTTRKHIGA